MYPLSPKIWTNWFSFLLTQKTDVISSVPREILWSIFSYLQLKDIKAVSQTCKLLNNYANTAPYWSSFFSPRVKLPAGIANYRKLYQEIYRRIEFIFSEQQSNYKYFLDKNLIKINDIAAMINTSILPERGQEVCIITGDYVDDTDKESFKENYAYFSSMDRKNQWEPPFKLLQPGSVRRSRLPQFKRNKGDLIAIVIQSTDEIEVNEILKDLNETYTSLPFVYVLGFNNSNMRVENIRYPIMHLINMCYTLNGSMKNPAFLKAWSELVISLARLGCAKKNLANLRSEPVEPDIKKIPLPVWEDCLGIAARQASPSSDCSIL
ncbi:MULTISPECIES: F-box protein [unclassified Legionella]|uniref:F-box protein n=1 Tax=unclassified Legionella TaxID=2622702 RepID=UPI001056D0A7|nr:MULTISPECIES: F-box protein [unclassified Legionella]MDI9817982.1 F-box protein [Legionella sp. PL877]